MHLDRLPNQQKDEKVILFLRRHWTAIFVLGLMVVLLYVIPGVLVWYFYDYLRSYVEHDILGPIIAIIATMYILSVWLFAYLELVDYYLDVLIITNRRTIKIDQKGLFNRTASELHLAAVQDVTSEVKGILHTFMDFGTIYIQTAAEDVRFTFKNVAHPEDIKEKVIRLVEEEKRRYTH